MGCTKRRLVAAFHVTPPWFPIEVKIDQKWKRAVILRQADHRGLCLVSIKGTPDSEPIMVPLSTIRVPPPLVAKRRRETAAQIQVKKKPRSSEDGENAQ